jgi:23S rRNA pseudouridine1911/1915/1917 synthase
LARHSFHVGPLDPPSRIDQFLARQPGLPSRSRLKALFREGLITLNGKPAPASARLKPGDEIMAEVPEPANAGLEPEPIPLTVIYEDEHVIVFDKPAGLLTHPTPGRTTGTLVNALLYHCRGLSGVGGAVKPGIVHRLDKLTSGVMVAAKSDLAHHGLAAQFKAHSIDRKYLAVVYGEMEKLSGAFETVIGRNPRHRLKMTSRTEKGRRAVTRFRTLARHGGMSLVELTLETGRTHQIRVHLSEHNHPVAGDALYGKGRTAPSRLGTEARSALRRLDRQALHAYRLGFDHPAGGERMVFESPLPQDIAVVASSLGLLAGVKLPAKPDRVR